MSGQTLNVYLYIYIYIYILCDILLSSTRCTLSLSFYLFIKHKLVELVSEVSFFRGAAAGVDYFLSMHFSPENNILFKENIFTF